jgi:hypothetical protein
MVLGGAVLLTLSGCSGCSGPAVSSDSGVRGVRKVGFQGHFVQAVQHSGAGQWKAAHTGAGTSVMMGHTYGAHLHRGNA